MHERLRLAAFALMLVLTALAAPAEAETDDFRLLLGSDPGVAIFQDYERPAGVHVRRQVVETTDCPPRDTRS